MLHNCKPAIWVCRALAKILIPPDGNSCKQHYSTKLWHCMSTVCEVRLCIWLHNCFVYSSACLVPYHLKISSWVYSITSSVSFKCLKMWLAMSRDCNFFLSRNLRPSGSKPSLIDHAVSSCSTCTHMYRVTVVMQHQQLQCSIAACTVHWQCTYALQVRTGCVFCTTCTVHWWCLLCMGAYWVCVLYVNSCFYFALFFH